VFYFALTQGLGIGEMLRLRWSNLTGNALDIERDLTLGEAKNVVGTPKTERGYRRLYLKEDAVAVL
jgi:integrase